MYAEAESSSGGLLLGVASTTVNTTNTSNITSEITGGTIAATGTIQVNAINIGSAHIHTNAAAIGLIGAGSASAKARSNISTIAKISGASISGNSDVEINATGKTVEYIKGTAGSGGLVAGAGVDLEIDNDSITLAELASNATILDGNHVSINSSYTALPLTQVVSKGFGLIGGTGAEVDIDITSSSRANVFGDVTADKMTVNAENDVSRRLFGGGVTHIEGDAGGLASGASAETTADINFDTQITISGKTVIEGDVDLDVFNRVNFADHIALFTAGAVSGAGAYTTLNAEDIIGTITIASASTTSEPGMYVAGDLTAVIDGHYDVDLHSMTETYGIGTVAIGTATSLISPINSFLLDGGLLVRGDADVFAGTDRGRTITDPNVIKTYVDNFAGSAIPINELRAIAMFTNENNITVNEGAIFEGYQNINLIAEVEGDTTQEGKTKGTNWASAIGDAIDGALGGTDSFGNFNSTVNSYGTVTNNGLLKTGALRHQTITFDHADTDSATGAIVSNGPSEIGYQTGNRTVAPTQTQAISKARTALNNYSADTATTSVDIIRYQQDTIIRLELEMIQQGTAEFRAKSNGAVVAGSAADAASNGFSLGFANYTVDGVSVNIVPRNVTATTIIIEDIVAQAGYVFITANQLTGGGVFDAPGNASVEILNGTHALLVINDVTIPAIDGGVFFNSFNEAISNNATPAEANALVILTNDYFRKIAPDPASLLSSNFTFGPDQRTLASPEGTPTITIRNTFGYLSDLPATGPLPATANILVQGNIFTTGELILESKPDGLTSNITITGSIDAGRLTIDASGTVNIDTDTDFQAGGNPELALIGATPVGIFGNQTGYDGYDAENNPTSSNYITYAGQAVPTNADVEFSVGVSADYINVSAEYVNVNGVLEAGTANYNLTLGSAVQAEIDRLEESSSANDRTQIGSAITGSSDFFVTYTKSTDTITIEPLDTAGGKIYIEGRVVSTSTRGKLRAYDGYAQVNITNNLTSSGLKLDISGIDASTRGLGQIEILDKQQSRSTVYEVLDNGSIRRIVEVDGTSTGDSTVIVAENGLNYTPMANMRYGWAISEGTREIDRWVVEQNGWIGIDALVADASRTDPTVTIPVGQATFIDEEIFFFEQADVLDYRYTPQAVSTEGPIKVVDTTSTTTWYGKTTHTTTSERLTDINTTHYHTIKASYPIGLEFFGAAAGLINIQGGNANVIVSGDLSNTNGTTIINTTGSVITSDSFQVPGSSGIVASNSIGGKVITITAGRGVGTSTSALNLNLTNDPTANVTITSLGGDINAKQVLAYSFDAAGGSSVIDNAFRIGTINAGTYSVTLSSEKDIVQLGSTSLITGGSITLNAVNDIGVAGNAIRTDMGNLASHTLSVTSENGSVHIDEVAGNLRIDQVNAQNDVGITVRSGDLIDANTSVERDERARSALEAGLWANLDLTDSGKIDDVLKIAKDAETAEYRNYWSWRQLQGDNHADILTGSDFAFSDEEIAYYEDFFGAEFDAGTYTGTRADYITDAVNTLRNTRSEVYRTLDARWGTATVAYDDTFKATLAADRIAAITASIKIWTPDELLNGFSAGVLKPVVDTDIVIEKANISGTIVTLNVSGNIGRTSGQELLDLTNGVSSLSTDQLATLGAAEPDDVFFLISERITGVVSINSTTGTITHSNSAFDWAAAGFLAGQDLQLEGSVEGNSTEEGPFYTIESIAGNVITIDDVGDIAFKANEYSQTLSLSTITLDPRGVSLNVTADFTASDTMNVTVGDISDLYNGMKLLVSEQRAADGSQPNETENDNDYQSLYRITAITGTSIQLELMSSDGTTQSQTQISLEAGTGLAIVLDEYVEVRYLQVQLRDDLDLALGGALNATAGGQIFLGADTEMGNSAATGVVLVGAVNAGDEVRIKATNGIVNGLGTLTEVNVDAASALLEGGQGGVGTLDNRILLNLDDGGRITARATDGIYLEETMGSMSVGTMFSLTGDVNLLSDGSILDVVGEDFTNILATNIVLHSQNGSIGADGNALDIETRGDSAAIGFGLLTAFAANDIFVTETVGNMSIRNVFSTTGDVRLQAQNSIIDAVDVETPSSTTTGDVTTSTQKLGVDVTGQKITLVTLAGTVGTAMNELDIDSGNSINGTVTVSSFSNTYLRQSGNMYINSIGVLSSDPTTTAFITVIAGGILNGALIAGASNVTSGRVFLSASQNIGTSTKSLESTVGVIQSVSTNGDTYVHNTGALSVTAFNSGVSGLGQSSGGALHVVAESPITIVSNATSVGEIIYKSTEDNGAADGITLNANVSVTSTGSSILMESGDDILIEAGASLQAKTSVQLFADVDEDGATGTDVEGATIDIRGTITATDDFVSIDGNTDRDTLVVTGSINAGTTITVDLKEDKDAIDLASTAVLTAPVITLGTGAGNDTITLTEGASLRGAAQINGGSGDDVIVIDRLNQQAANDSLGIDGGGDTDHITIQTFGSQTGGTNYVIDINDTGAIDNGEDTMTILGTGENDVFLSRGNFVALLHGTKTEILDNTADRPATVERINYNRSINARMTLEGMDGDDVFISDDNGTLTTFDGGLGNDEFQFGQIFGHDPVSTNDVSGVATGDNIKTTQTTRGYLSIGNTYASIAFGGKGDDRFTVYSNKATIQLEGEDDNDEFVVRAFLKVDGRSATESDIKLNAGAGNDLIQYNINAPVNIDGGAGFDTVVALGTEGDDVFVVTEDGIRGAGLNIGITNTEESIQADGLEGNDTFYILSTREGAVTKIIGGLGSDTFNIAGDVNDTVISQDPRGRSSLVAHSTVSIDGDYNNLLVGGISAVVADDTLGQVVLSQGAAGDTTPGVTEVSEVDGGTTDVYSVVLSAMPSAAVYVTVSATRSSSQDRAISVPSMTGTPNLTLDATAKTITRATGNWETDGFDEHMSITLAGAGDSTGTYEIMSLTATTITVRETFAQEFTAASGITATGQTASGVQLSKDGNDYGDAVVLVFDASNWDQAQNVTVKAQDDAASEGLKTVEILHAIDSVDASFDAAKVDNMVVNVADNDRPGIRLIETGPDSVVLEDAAAPGNSEILDSYSAVLTRQPASGEIITVTLGGDVDNDLILTNETNTAITSLTFTHSNWDVPQLVNIKASAADGIENEERITVSHMLSTSASTGEYVDQILQGGVDVELKVTVVDGDGAGVFIQQSNGNTVIIDQLGQTDSYTVRLTSAPTATVVVDIVDDGQTQVESGGAAIASQLALLTQSLTFTSVVNGPDTITRVTGDFLVDGFKGGQAVDITGTVSNNGAYLISEIAADGKTITVGDNSRLENETGTATLNVTVYQLTFTTTNWNVAQTVMLKADHLFIPSVADYVTYNPENGTHTMAEIRGPLQIDGGNTGRGLNAAVMLITETAGDAIGINIGNLSETTQNDVLNIFNDSSVINDVGFLTTNGNATDGYSNLLNGLSMGMGQVTIGSDAYDLGIDYRNIDVTEILLGRGNDTLTVSITEETADITTQKPITVIHGGGGGDTITLDSIADDSLFVVFGDTDVTGARYNYLGGASNGNGLAFNAVDNAANHGDTIDASALGANTTVAIYGGVGDDTLTGGAGDDHIAGGAGADIIRAGAGNDHIYGDSGFAIDLLARNLVVSNVIVADPRFDSADTLTAGVDDIDAGAGDDIIFGDYGYITQQVDTLRLATTGLVTRAKSMNNTVGSGDTIVSGSGNDIVIGGFGGDTISSISGENIVFGDGGLVEWLSGNSDIAEIDLITTIAASFGNIDQITGGTGRDIILGGAGGDTIIAKNGANIVIGDHGSITGKPNGALAAGKLSFTVDEIKSSDQAYGGDDVITMGIHDDVVVGGIGEDTITSDAEDTGRDIISGDGAWMTFRAQEADGTDVVDMITSYQGNLGANDTIRSGAGGDIVLGGVGVDEIISGDGNHIIFGDNGFLTGAAVGMIVSGQARITMQTAKSIAVYAGDNDTIRVGAGSTIAIGGKGADSINTTFGSGPEGADIILGDNGVIVQNTETGSVIAHLLRVETTFDDQGDVDYITTGYGGDVILAGLGDDIVNAGDGNNIIFGDNGEIVGLDIAPVDGQGRPITLDTLSTTEAGIGGIDTIIAGLDSDIVMGGAQGDFITTNATETAGLYDAADIVIGDHGFMSFLREGGAEYASKIVSINPLNGGNDVIRTGAGNDIIVGGTADDSIIAGADNDLIFGDHAKIEGVIRPQDLPIGAGRAFDFKSIFSTTADLGGSDWIDAGSGDDAVLGQTGGDTIFGNAGDDDIVGGHNVGLDQLENLAQDGDDAIDGGAGDDVILGDNGTIYRSFAPEDTRMRALDGSLIYGVTSGINDGDALTGSVALGNVDGTEQRVITIFDHTAGADPSEYGNDYIAGGAEDDMIFGQMGDDIVQGDGSIDFDLDGYADNETGDRDGVGAWRDATTGLLTVNSSLEDWLGAGRDGDDYIAGNGGNDIVFGNLGQDDIVGGSSSMFEGLSGDSSTRPDGSDMLYGGAGTDIVRNDLGDASGEGHARDADVIVGDNANIYRVVGINGASSGEYLTYEYDTYSSEVRIIPRAVEYLDYSVGGPDLNAYATIEDQGGADEIHGESGDDVIYGLTGSDVIFGDGQDDDIIGGWGHDWISAGTGSDGVIGDDGRIITSRNSTLHGEALYGISALAEVNQILQAEYYIALRTLINVDKQLMKTVNLTPFSSNPADDNDSYLDAQQANDIIYGGWGDDFLHGAYGDDAISGAEALSLANDPRDSHLNQISFDTPFNAGNSLAYNPTAGDGDPLQPFFNPDDPRSQFNVGGMNFFLNFNPNEGLIDSRSESGYTTDGDDRIFGDLGNEVIISGTGRDQVYGGYGDDYINADDDQSGNNNLPNEDISYEDFVFGGAGEDILIANSVGDRLIDWGGEFNSYYTTYQSVGEPTVINDYTKQLVAYLIARGAADRADPTRAADIAGDVGVFLDPLYVAGEPFGELGIVVSNDTEEFAKQYGPNRFRGRGAPPPDAANPQATPIRTDEQLAPSPAGNFGDSLPGIYVAGSIAATTVVSPLRTLPDMTTVSDFVSDAGFQQVVGSAQIIPLGVQANLTGAARPGYASFVGPAVQSEIIIDVAALSNVGNVVQTFIYNSQTGEFEEATTPQTPLSQAPDGTMLELRDEDGMLFAYVDANGGLWIIDDIYENPDNLGDAEADDWIYSGEVSNIGGLIVLAGVVPAVLPTARPRLSTVHKSNP